MDRKGFNTPRLEQIIARVPQQVFWKDKNLVYRGCNDNFAKAAGFDSVDKIIGKTDSELPWKDYADIYNYEDRKVIDSAAEILDQEVPFVRKNKESRTILVNKVPLLDDAGKIIGVLGVYTDITELKKTKDDLQIQIEKTKQANRSKTEILSTAAHEIRSPVSNVINFMRFLKEQVDRLQSLIYDQGVKIFKEEMKQESISELTDCFNNILENYHAAQEEAYRSLNALINLGNLHNLEMEGVKPHWEVTDVVYLIENAIDHSTYPNEQHIDIQCEFDKNVPEKISVDFSNLYEALRIFIGNAIRFSAPHNRIIVKVEVIKDSKKPALKVVIQDFGSGISKTQLDHLFIPLFSSTTGSEPLTQETRYRKPSLQLSQAKMRVEASGGTLIIESAPQEGTRVTIKIPYSELKDTPVNLGTLSNPSMCYLLLIEDDRITQKIIQIYLKELGYHVEIVESGKQAIKLALKNDYDLILLDITLPDISGLEVLRQVQAKKGETIPFIAITSHASEEDEDYFIGQGVMTVLSKPVDKATLKNSIEAALIAQQDED